MDATAVRLIEEAIIEGAMIAAVLVAAGMLVVIVIGLVEERGAAKDLARRRQLAETYRRRQERRW
jgi:hypothetical protein